MATIPRKAARQGARGMADTAGDVPRLSSVRDIDAVTMPTKPQLNKTRSAKAPGRINLRAVAEVLAEAGLDPTVEMVNILTKKNPMRARDGSPIIDPLTNEPLMEDAIDADVKLRMLNELLQYTQPKLKSIELSGPKGGPLVIEQRITDEQARRMAMAYLTAAVDDGK